MINDKFIEIQDLMFSRLNLQIVTDLNDWGAIENC